MKVAFEFLAYLKGKKYPDGYSRSEVMDGLEWLVKKGYARYVDLGRGKYTYEVTEKGKGVRSRS